MADADDPMPVFVIKGKDLLAGPAVQAYREICRTYGLHDQAAQVDLALREIHAWQGRHPERLKMPDHEHVPATSGPAEERTGLREADDHG